MQIRPSRVLQKLRSGQVASCFKINLACSRAVEIVGMSGFDCVWIDMEHTACDWSVVEKQILAAKVYNMDGMVRVARGGYSDYIKPLELDAAGIMVPHVMNLEDARRVVRMTRFHPVGRRPIDGGNADGAYTNLDIVEYAAQANTNRFIAIQIEDPEPLDDLEKIAKLPGIDIIFFGPGDFSHGIGVLGDWNNAKISETRKRVADVAIANNKIAGTVGTLDNMESLIKMGYRFINLGADVIGLSQYCKTLSGAFRNISDPPSLLSK